MQIRYRTKSSPATRIYSRLKWYLSALSTTLTTMFVIALEAEF